MTALRILIVEDNEMNLTLARDLLEARGHEVVTATSPEVALAHQLEQLPDLVLMDIMLPGMDGVQLMQELQKRPGWSMVPFIAFTAHAMVGDRERLLADGFAAYISKPIETRRFGVEVEKHAGGIRSKGPVSHV